MSEAFERLLGRNAKTYLSKPFPTLDFHAAVAKLLGISELLDQSNSTFDLLFGPFLK